MSTQAFKLSFVIGARRLQTILKAIGTVDDLSIVAVSGNPSKSAAHKRTPVEQTRGGKAALSAFSNQYASVTELVASFHRAGLSASSVSPVMSQLRKAGKVVKEGKSGWRRV